MSPVSRGSYPPVPFIVGSPRSGTTLLRLMLDSHPELAIPPETGFLYRLARLPAGDAECRQIFAERLCRDRGLDGAWVDFGIPERLFVAELGKIRPFNVADGLRCFYRLYARRFNKPRWGDKTPLYCRELAALTKLFPEARFVHLIRDGRDSVASLRQQWFAPGPTLEFQARYWRRNVLAARRQARHCRHYLEVRYEDLVREPETSLRRICAFLELDWDGALLRHRERAAARIAEHGPRLDSKGRVLVSVEQRQRQQAASIGEPDPARIGRWREQLSRSEQWRFGLVAGDLLRELGYDR